MRAHRLRRFAAVGLVLVAAAATAGCSDLLAGDDDVVVRMEAEDRAAVRRVRQEVLAGAPDFGGVRVGEQTVDTGSSALVFSLPGDRLEIALGFLDRLEADVVSTDIDVDVRQLERDAAEPSDASERGDRAADEGVVRLRIEVDERRAEGVDGALRAVMAIFSVIGVVASVRWVRDRVSGRGRPRPPRRRIDRVDLRGDPPTEETPRITGDW